MGAGQSSITNSSSNLNSASNNDSDYTSLSAQLASRHGFQIIRVHPNSPVSEAQVSPYFDYIIAVNGVEVSPDIPNLIGEMAKNHVNKPLRMTVYNSRQDEQREITIVPRTGWGGEGLLGCAIRFSPLEGVRDRVWHILKVQNNSPAQRAGLIQESDFIIASPDMIIRSQDDFYELITQNMKREIKLIVFSVNLSTAEEDESRGLREVTIVPDFEWGGEGCLGCDVGSGMLHWVPKKITITTTVEELKKQKPSPSPSSLSNANDQGQNETETNFISDNSHIQSSAPIAPGSVGQSLLFNSTSQISQNSTASVPTSVPSVPVLVQVPSTRPVIDNLSLSTNSNSNSSTDSSNINNMSMPSFAPPPPTIPPTIEFNDDDIPKPNFSVPSDIVSIMSTEK